ncbi:hypothetical protein, partial [Streptomyces sp. F-1]|uniref:hypothetical protein n=1 Tax=Streptomyces sp. F-1 TaxID=463642 RepID=UPI00196002A5
MIAATKRLPDQQVRFLSVKFAEQKDFETSTETVDTHRPPSRLFAIAGARRRRLGPHADPVPGRSARRPNVSCTCHHGSRSVTARDLAHRRPSTPAQGGNTPMSTLIHGMR